MIYGSVCSGVEAATLAWHPLGWRAAFYSEIEPFPASVLNHHYASGRPQFMPCPDDPGLSVNDRRARAAAIKAVARLPERAKGTPNLGDLTQHRKWTHESIDLLVGGTPCQSFSVAGLRAGLDDPRGNLALEYLALAERARPRWLVWENVPGVLSSNGGRDFGSIVGALAKLGYGWAYRVLDAQYIRVDGYARAVPQRRRRVILVGYFGDWRRAAAVLFERGSMSGNPPPRREAGERVAPTISARPTGGGGLGTDFDLDGGLISMAHGQGGAEITEGHGPTLTCNHEAPIVAHALRGEGFDASEDGTGRGTPLVPVSVAIRGRDGGGSIEVGDDCAHALRASQGGGDKPHVLLPVAFDCKAGGDTSFSIGEIPGSLRGDGNGGGHAAVAFSSKDYGADAGEVSETLRAMGHDGSHANGGGQVSVATEYAVRRLTPRECERLQGFPDDYTRIPYRGREADACPDGPRYKAIGNSMAVNVMRWVGRRIEFVDSIAGSDR